MRPYMHQNSNRMIAILIMAISMVTTLSAQSSYVTYNHDDSKMNQIEVMETGAGSLTPEVYYTLLHGSYKKTAAEKNKLSFRTEAALGAYPQVEYADSIEAYLTARAEIEALNVADREIDLAWQTEGTKITSLLERFHNNINRIVPAGGSVEDRERWNTYYKVYQAAITATREAYMPNAQRKREYLNIYADLVKQNETLLKSLVMYNTQARTAELLSCRDNYQKSTKTSAITAAYNKWRESGWNTSSTSGTSSLADDDGDENVIR